MVKRQVDFSLVKLAVIGIILYVSIAIAASWLQDEPSGQEAESTLPSITKQQAADAAVRFVQERFGLSSDYRTGTLFQSHSDRSGYLQKEKLLDDYVKQFTAYPIDYYEVEINDSSKLITYYVDVNFANLSIMGWNAYTAPSAKKETVSTGAVDSKSIAEKTLKDQSYVLSELTMINQAPPAEEQKTATRGTGFIYESNNKQIGDAKLRLSVTVDSGKAVSFRSYFAIPSSFTDWKEQQNDNASKMTRISLVASLIMAASALFIVIRYRKELTFRRGLFLTVLFLGIYIGNNFNMIPAFRTMHSSGPSQWEAMFNVWFLNIVIAIMAVSVYFSFQAGRHMWQRQGWITWPVWKDASFASHVRTSMIRGYLLCIFILAVQQTLFFIAGEYFDVWAVNDPADSVLNMTWPALFPLMAWAAAISEEAIYRLFGIAFFLKLVRNRFLAVLLPSMIWALSHTQYPIYPVYTRFVEVTIIGIIFGYAFLKYGLMTVLFAHASMDSILMGLSLFDMNSTPLITAGIFYILFPGLIGLAVAWLHAKIKGNPPILNPDH
ncbi:CPBP family intramembrane glutamic endopeptidase [Paenibacillus sp. UNC451MF]|uniref:CPBP family intramembrane glutamic endopeptidase n=1 Tax=Paenibacillus sp. UNC451MF TaxID=1449063 RepID=UPI00048EB686|nr:CPBP family intramembrane glutamic endopeptidase [Paenibacillus sp. UNC451MF]